MIFNRIFLIIFFLVLASCSGLDFVYKSEDSYKTPLYNKTIYEFVGKEIPSIYRYASKYFGNGEEPKNKLTVFVEEVKIKRSVQTNQAVSKLDYELKFDFKLEDMSKKCVIYEKVTYSKFSYEPKASGYNFGSDKSLENMYDLATKESFRGFLDYVIGLDLSKCNNED